MLKKKILEINYTKVKLNSIYNNMVFKIIIFYYQWQLHDICKLFGNKNEDINFLKYLKYLPYSLFY